MNKRQAAAKQKTQALAQANRQQQSEQPVAAAQSAQQQQLQLDVLRQPEMPIQPQQEQAQITSQPLRGQQIRCSINNCHYWAAGNNCTARQVLVTSQLMSQGLNANFDAPMATQLAATPVAAPKESCCNTFTPRSSHGAFEDGVLKVEQPE